MPPPPVWPGSGAPFGPPPPTETSEGAVESGIVEEEVRVEVLFVFVLLPVGCGFWVKVVTIDERNVVCWLLGPTLTMEDKNVEVTTTGGELWLPPDVEEIEFPFPEELLD